MNVYIDEELLPLCREFVEMKLNADKGDVDETAKVRTKKLAGV